MNFLVTEGTLTHFSITQTGTVPTTAAALHRLSAEQVLLYHYKSRLFVSTVSLHKMYTVTPVGTTHSSLLPPHKFAVLSCIIMKIAN